MFRPATTGAWLLALAGCQASPEPRVAAESTPPARAEPQSPPAWAVVLRPHTYSVGRIDADVWKDGTLAVSAAQVRSYRDIQGDRLSNDFPVSLFTDVAAGEDGFLWATAGRAIYRSAGPVAPLEPVEGVGAWRVAAVGGWGAVCSDGQLFRVPLHGPPKAESMERGCERIESTRELLYVEGADGWSASSDLEAFTSQTPPLEHRVRTADRLVWPGMGPIARVGGAWRTPEGALTDEYGLIGGGENHGTSTDPPHERRCQPSVGAAGIRAICSDRELGDVLYGWNDGWSKLYARADGEEAWLRGTVSRFSDLAAFTGPCDAGASLDPTELAVCLIEPGGEPRTHRWSPELCKEDDWRCQSRDEIPGFTHLDLQAMDAGVVVYSINREGEDHLLDLREESSAPLPPCEVARLVGPSHLECTSSERYDVNVFSLANGSVTPISLPEGTRWAGFATDDRGLAAGLNAASLWTTVDGGVSWEPVNVELSGKPDSLPLAAVQCTNIACGAGPVVWVDDEIAKRLGLESVRYVGFERTPLEAHRMSPPW